MQNSEENGSEKSSPDFQDSDSDVGDLGAVKRRRKGKLDETEMDFYGDGGGGGGQSPAVPFAVPGNSADDHGIRMCSEFEWRCHYSSECIGVYDVCDGIAQCGDKSDEDREMCRERTALMAHTRRRPALRPSGQDAPAAPQSKEKAPAPAPMPTQVAKVKVHTGTKAPANNTGTSSTEGDIVSKLSSLGSSLHVDNSLALVLLGMGLSLVAVLIVFVACCGRNSRTFIPLSTNDPAAIAAQRRRRNRRPRNLANKSPIDVLGGEDEDEDGTMLMNGLYL